MEKVKKSAKKAESKAPVTKAPKAAPVKKSGEVKTCCQVFKAGDAVKLEGFDFCVMEVTGNKIVLKDKSL